MDEDDNIRQPDDITRTRLVGDYSENENDNDTEMKLAMDVSRNDFMELRELQMAMEMSIEEHIIQSAKEASYRKKSLENFCNKIKVLSLSVQYNDIKIYMENVLADYFELKNDFVYVENDMYKKIFSIIDTYYLIPVQNKRKKTAITEDEDRVLRTIFLSTYIQPSIPL